MKFKAGIYGENKALNRDLFELLKDNKSIEAVLAEENCQEKKTMDARNFDFIYSTYEPQSEHYARCISSFVRAGVPVVAFQGDPGRKIPVVRICRSTGSFEHNGLKQWALGGQYCIMEETDEAHSPQSLVDLSELSIKKFYLTQRQTRYYQ